MRKTFDFYMDEESYIIKNTNPNDEREPFTINKTGMEFDSIKFYEYIFADINQPLELEIVNKIENEADKVGGRVYSTVNDICQGVIRQLNEDVLG